MINTWTTKEGEKIKIVDMETSHIENCIKMLERDMPEVEEDEDIWADHWSLSGYITITGAKHYREKIKMFNKELSNR